MMCGGEIPFTKKEVMNLHLLIYGILSTLVILFAGLFLVQIGYTETRGCIILEDNKIIQKNEELICCLRSVLDEKNIEIEEIKKNAEMMIALRPLKDYYTDDEISEILKEIPHGKIFRGDFRCAANFGESVGFHGAWRLRHQGWDIYPVGDDWMITPLAAGESVNFSDNNIYGLNITIQHSERVQSFYAHGETVYNRATRGNMVEADTVIMKMGESGLADGPHLHFEIRVKVGANKYVAIDPEPFVDR